ncbi:MAG: hypothetical protein NZM65_09715 [Flavobacteriales bacterium]|nr:hypothetical protein [Flavobacteriales bacterium]MDW8410947.1 hypothetical protein [Flavobacteriales bacterium]
MQKRKHKDVHSGSAGPIQVWYFSTFIKTQEILTGVDDAFIGSPQAELFPTANLVEKYSNGRYVYVM